MSWRSTILISPLQVTEILGVLELEAFDARHRLLCGIGSQFAKAELASAGTMDDFVIDGPDLACRHAPAFRRSLLEHGAGRGADLAHRDQIMPRAARAVGILVAELDLVAMRLLDADSLPVGFKFFGDDQRQAGAHPGSHLGAVRDDGHDSIGGDRDEHARIDHDAVRHLAGAGLIGKSVTRHHGRSEHEATGDAEAFEDAATRNVLDLDVLLEAAKLALIGEDIHVTPPWMRDGRHSRCAGSSRTDRYCRICSCDGFGFSINSAAACMI